MARIVSIWLIPQAGADPVGPAKIQGNHLTFQEWYWERETMRGASDDDIRAYPTIQVVDAMREWAEAGKPS